MKKLRVVLVKEAVETCIRGLYGDQVEKVLVVAVDNLTIDAPDEKWLCTMAVKLKDTHGLPFGATVGVTVSPAAEGEDEEKVEVFRFSTFSPPKEEETP